MKNWKTIYISHHLKTITNYYLTCVFYTLKNFPTYPNIGRVRLFQNVITRSCHIYKFTGKIKSQLIFWKTPIFLLTCGVNNTFERITSNPHLKNKWLHIKSWHLLYISHHLSILTNWYLQFSIYSKYLLTFQQGLFCKLGCGITFFKLL
jgi:hypothetical protein